MIFYSYVKLPEGTRNEGIPPTIDQVGALNENGKRTRDVAANDKTSDCQYCQLSRTIWVSIRP